MTVCADCGYGISRYPLKLRATFFHPKLCIYATYVESLHARRIVSLNCPESAVCLFSLLKGESAFFSSLYSQGQEAWLLHNGH